MAKPNALDAKVAEIDLEIARLESALDRWKGMRDYLTHGSVAHVAADDKPKAKRGRGKNNPKPGLPETSTTVNGGSLLTT